MIQRKSYKFRLVSNSKQRRKFAQFAGCNRVVWNKALFLAKQSLEKNEKVLNYAGLCKEITSWKKEEGASFLKDADSQALQQTAKDHDRAFKDFFKKHKGMPRFKKKGLHDSFRFPQRFKFVDDRVSLPKVGFVKFHKSQDIEGTPKNVTISKRAGEWYMAVQVEMEVAEPKHPSDKEIGNVLAVDMKTMLISMQQRIF